MCQIYFGVESNKLKINTNSYATLLMLHIIYFYMEYVLKTDVSMKITGCYQGFYLCRTHLHSSAAIFRFKGLLLVIVHKKMQYPICLIIFMESMGQHSRRATWWKVFNVAHRHYLSSCQRVAILRTSSS